ncbi:hypothetical protein BN1723_020666, partial [Verticillium longisporum]
RPPWPKSTR